MADEIAQPHTCTRCSGTALITIVDRCAACIGEMGLRAPEEYRAFKEDVNAAFGRK